MKSQQVQNQTSEVFAALPAKGVALLTTFRRSGEGVRHAGGDSRAR